MAREDSAFDRRLASAREDQAELVGKRIEGTGWLRFRYCTMIGGLLVLALLLWLGVRIYGLVNPVVGVGAATAGRVASTALAAGFRQVVAGGEAFKTYVESKLSDPATRGTVLDLFRRAHRETQSEDVQTIVRDITR